MTSKKNKSSRREFKVLSFCSALFAFNKGSITNSVVKDAAKEQSVVEKKADHDVNVVFKILTKSDLEAKRCKAYSLIA